MKSFLSLLLLLWATLVASQGNSENAPGLDENGPGNSEAATDHSSQGNSEDAPGLDESGPGNSENVTDHSTHVSVECTFDTILARCGDVYMASIDDEAYGRRVLRQWDTNVVNKCQAYANKLRTDPYVEGRDNPDVAMAYCFMHYICFDPIILNGEEHKVYKCMLGMCPRIEGIEAWCEGMNS